MVLAWAHKVPGANCEWAGSHSPFGNLARTVMVKQAKGEWGMCCVPHPPEVHSAFPLLECSCVELGEDRGTEGDSDSPKRKRKQEEEVAETTSEGNRGGSGGQNTGEV